MLNQLNAQSPYGKVLSLDSNGIQGWNYINILSWALTGNNTSGNNFWGTINIDSLMIRVCDTLALRIIPSALASGLVGGFPDDVIYIDESGTSDGYAIVCAIVSGGYPGPKFNRHK